MLLRRARTSEALHNVASSQLSPIKYPSLSLSLSLVLKSNPSPVLLFGKLNVIGENVLHFPSCFVSFYGPIEFTKREKAGLDIFVPSLAF